MLAGEIDYGGVAAGVALKLRRCLAVWGGLALTVFAGAQGNLPPDVPATTILTAPETSVPSGLGGSNVYRGTYTYAGSYLIESSTYNAVAGKPEVSFTVRSAATHGVKYTLKPGAGFKGQADPEVFSDGSLLAIPLRDTPNGQVRVSVHTLSTGKLLFTLRQPDAKSGDYFGGKVWFTSDRILVAASGVDRPQTNGGGLYVYNRTNGRFVGFAGSGVKNAYFGAPPYDQGIPYFQSSGRAALFVHGNRLFRFASDRLEKVSLPPQGTNKVWPAGALISGNYLVVRTGEQKANGTGAQGRVIVYDAKKRTVRYQLRASGLKGGYDFPSGIAISGSRLFVHDSSAAYPDSSRRGVIGAYVLSSGKPAGVRSFAKAEGVYQDGGSFALSGGLLWIKTSGDGQPTRWLGCDPATLKHVRTLTPPAGSRFAGLAGPPQSLSGNRFGVIALRTEENPGAFLTPMSFSGGTGGSVASVVVISPGGDFTQTTVGVLVYDMASSRWTHRLTLESEPASSYTAYFPDGYDRLRIAAGSTHAFRVALAEAGTKILGFDTALPSPAPAVALESSISYVPQFGYSHELLRKAAGAGDFTLLKELPFGDGATHAEILPYSDYKDGVRYRLDGTQFSRRLSTPGPEQVVLNTGELATLAAVRGDIVALRVRGAYNPLTQSYAANSVRLVNVLTGAEVRTVYPTRGNGSGPVAFNDTYIVVGSPGSVSGDIEVFDATTGGLLRSFSGGRSFGSQLVLADDRLATSEITSSYQTGAYTYISRLRVYRLTDGELVQRLPLATETSTSSFSTLPVTLVGAGGKVAARGYPEGGSFADAGEVRVYDMLTGVRLFTVTAPEPAAGDYFGSALAAGGNALAVEASGSGEVSVFDLTTGALRHTLVIMDRSSGSLFGNSTLSIDAAGDYLSWLVNDQESGGLFNAKAAHVFDLNTGLEEVKVLQPDAGGLSGAGSFAEVLFTNRGLVARTSAGKILDYDLVETLATPLAVTSVLLDQVPVVRLQFPARKGVSYQPEFSADAGLTWEVLGSRHHGNGAAADLRIPLEGVVAPEALRFRLNTRWETAPVPTGLTPGGPS